jgi:hypothetical protein
MRMAHEPETQQPATPPGGESVSRPTAAGASRRELVCESAKKLIWLTPVVLLFRPNEAVAKSHTGWTHP